MANPEASILLQIKVALDPDGRILKSWVPGGSFEGVAWNGEGKVANISLQGRGLRGFIPSTISELTSLSGLYLHYNKLHGSIPTMLYKLNGLTELYLNVNLLSGSIPSELGTLYNLQALQLCCNSLEGSIPMELGGLKQLTVLALQHNNLMGEIPSSLGYLASLMRLDLSFNQLNGSIPASLGALNELTMVDVSSNRLSGPAPPALRRLREGFEYRNNSMLCGEGFTNLQSCSQHGSSTQPSSSGDVGQARPDQPLAGVQPSSSSSSSPVSNAAESANPHLIQKKMKLGSKTTQVVVVSGIVAFAAGGLIIGLLIFVLFRRHKQKISSAFEVSDTKLADHHIFSSEQKLFAKVDADASVKKSSFRKPPPSMAVLDHSIVHHASASTSHRVSRSFGSFSGVVFFNGSHQSFQYDLEELEMATNYFSDKNLLGKKAGHSAVYRGVLRDGSCVAIRAVHKASCRTPSPPEFKSVVGTIAQLRHENIVSLKGFCFSSGKAECFLVYDFMTNGTLQDHLDIKKKAKAPYSGCLDWAARARIANNIARGLQFMHRGADDVVVHQNVSAANVLLDQNCNAFLSDAGLHRLLADDIVFSALKSSAARGYLAPEYVTTGRLTEKSDVYAFGVLLLQLLTGKRPLYMGEARDYGPDAHQTGSGVINMVSWARSLVGAGCIEELMDLDLNEKYSCAAATHMAAVAFSCTHEDAGERPDMVEVVRLLQKMDACAETMMEAGLSSGEDYPRRQQALFAERLLDDGR